ncbi:DUF6009 family protein [Streptomyces sp. NPDC006459]|uniref:DUF6009 family protein n=1 Tax=Streptomyces sp. NPDC006459 TaxID=3154303 RepID=UPI0033A1882E
MSKDFEAIRHEESILWTEDTDSLDYVREYLEVNAGTRRRPVPWRGPGRRVGYSVLKADAPSLAVPGKFARRVFWVKEYDRSEQPTGTYETTAPSEAVDPRTVAPGVWGELTDRAWGAPLPQKAQRPPTERRGRSHVADSASRLRCPEVLGQGPNRVVLSRE